MSGVKFYLEQEPDKNGEHPIIMSVYVRGTRLLSTIGYNVAEQAWVNGKVKQGIITKRGIPYNVINLRIKKVDAEFEDYSAKIDHKPTRDELAELLAAIKGVKRKRKSEEEKEVAATEETFEFDIFSIFRKFIKEESIRRQWSRGTKKCIEGLSHHLKKIGCKDLDFFNRSGLDKAVSYFRSTCAMNESTAQAKFKQLRWFLRWCIREGYTTETAITTYRPAFKTIEKPVIYLTRDELLTLFKYKVPKNGTKVKLKSIDGKEYEKVVNESSALEKTKDLFCFCAFTSLRYSDMAKLKKVDISKNIVNVVTQKTNEKITIELNDYSAAILNKYKDAELPGNLALPVISNQKMNDYIKELGELCGFNELISGSMQKGGKRVNYAIPKWQLLGTHAARRTFICFALGVGIPPQTVMKWTGHSDYRAMKPYGNAAFC